jgi:hypothetical protein
VVVKEFLVASHVMDMHLRGVHCSAELYDLQNSRAVMLQVTISLEHVLGFCRPVIACGAER